VSRVSRGGQKKEKKSRWIPASAGMTEKAKASWKTKREKKKRQELDPGLRRDDEVRAHQRKSPASAGLFFH
jgi:hypothetical protein